MTSSANVLIRSTYHPVPITTVHATPENVTAVKLGVLSSVDSRSFFQVP